MLADSIEARAVVGPEKGWLALHTQPSHQSINNFLWPW
jgi:hypothetical protein